MLPLPVCSGCLVLYRFILSVFRIFRYLFFFVVNINTKINLPLLIELLPAKLFPFFKTFYFFLLNFLLYLLLPPPSSLPSNINILFSQSTGVEKEMKKEKLENKVVLYSVINVLKCLVFNIFSCTLPSTQC